jgi:two-component system nitrogen regulation sensor histidine kinase NtrY
VTFRRKILFAFSLTVFLSVAGVAWIVLMVTRTAFEKSEEERSSALVAQFQGEFDRRGEEVARRVESIASTEPVTRIGASTEGATLVSAEYLELARSLADSRQLDFLELLDEKGVIISSSQSPAKFGYPDAAFDTLAGLNQQIAFLKLEELQDSAALGLFAVRATRAGDHPVYVVGGRRIDKNFLAALALSPDMRVLLYQNEGNHFASDLLLDPSPNQKDSSIPRPPEKFRELIDAVKQHGDEMRGIVSWSSDQADEEIFHAIPLRGVAKDRPVLAILLVGNSRRSYVVLRRHIRDSAFLVGATGIVLAILLSSWLAARVTRPVEQLAQMAQDVAAGNWNSSVEVGGRDEVAQLAQSFNHMTEELLAQKERLVQTERVAAWRELARRLAHELKNPLFPLQLTVENLIRARTQSPEQFEEVFQESSQTLLAEISNLKKIIGRFSEFSKMPQPQLQVVRINDIVSAVAQLFQAQFHAPGRNAITCELKLDDNLQPIAADPELLHRALSNLVLNAMDAMSNGGKLTMRTQAEASSVIIEVADTGSGLTREECERIFTPYYTSKQHGTGLGLAIVQSVISDHQGRISVHSEPGRGTTFRIELPRNRVTPVRQQSAEADADELAESRRNVAVQSTSLDRR